MLSKRKWAIYSSFNVSLKGKAPVADEFLKPDSFPRPVRIILGRNKHKTSQPDVWSKWIINISAEHLLANAYCLTHKMVDLYVIMKQNTANIAEITERWFKDIKTRNHSRVPLIQQNFWRQKTWWHSYLYQRHNPIHNKTSILQLTTLKHYGSQLDPDSVFAKSMCW